MTEETRERALIVVVALAVIAGLGFDLVAGGVEAPNRLPVEGERIVEHASFCPPPVQAEGDAQVTVASTSDERLSVGFLPQSEGRLAELPPRQSRVVTNKRPVHAVGYGASLAGSSTVQSYKPVVGAGAARCSRVASSRWFFPEGSSALGFDERLVLFNPFPDEAVARITFFTPTGDISRARLAEGVAVPAGQARALRVNQFVQPEKLLAASVEMSRGRIVAWRSSIVKPKEQPAGVQFTLGATSMAPVWYLPAGSVEEGIEEKISLLNPTEEEAVVSISLVTAVETLQPPKLVEIPLAPRSARRIDLAEKVGRGQGDLGGVGVIVRATNEVGMVAERSLWYSLDAVSGVSSEIGAVIAVPRWLVGPALLKPTTDTVLILNPGPGRVTVEVSVLRTGPPAPRARLQDIKIPAGARRRIELQGEFSPMLLIESSGPVVAERSATSGRDAAAVLGTPAL